MCGERIALPTRVLGPAVPMSAVPLRVGLEYRADAFQGSRVSESTCASAGWPCWGVEVDQPAGVVGTGLTVSSHRPPLCACRDCLGSHAALLTNGRTRT